MWRGWCERHTKRKERFPQGKTYHHCQNCSPEFLPQEEMISVPINYESNCRVWYWQRVILTKNDQFIIKYHHFPFPLRRFFLRWKLLKSRRPLIFLRIISSSESMFSIARCGRYSTNGILSREILHFPKYNIFVYTYWLVTSRSVRIQLLNPASRLFEPKMMLPSPKTKFLLPTM